MRSRKIEGGAACFIRPVHVSIDSQPATDKVWATKSRQQSLGTVDSSGLLCEEDALSGHGFASYFLALPQSFNLMQGGEATRCICPAGKA